jgi:hypothetical protein
MKTSLALVVMCLFVAVALSGCGPRFGSGKSQPGVRLSELGDKSGGGNATAEDAVKSFVKAALSKDEKGIQALFAPDCKVPVAAIIINTEGWRQASRNLSDYEAAKQGNDVFVVKNVNTQDAIKMRFTAVNGKYLFVEGGP